MGCNINLIMAVEQMKKGEARLLVCVSALCFLLAFDTVGWMTGRKKPLYFCPVVSLSSFFFFFSSPNLSGRRVDVYTWCGLSANLGCRSEMCCTRLVSK